MSQQVSNSSAVIAAEIYSRFLVENLPEIMLPEGLARDVTDFGNGTTLNIPTVGTVTLQEAAEGTPLVFNPIDSGTVTLTINDFPGDAWSVTDVLKEDGYLVERLMQERAMESSRAMAEYFETKFLEACNDAQTANNDNLINGIKHRLVGGNTGRIELEDFAFMKYAFDKAKVPQMGRIAIVDPVVEYDLNKLYNSSWTVNNPMFDGIITEGFAQSHKFVTNIFGFDIWTSNLLPTLTAAEAGLDEADGTNTGASVGDVANIFMCVASDQTKPIMKAWRRMPTVEAWRDHEERKDKVQATGRFGLGAQRLDTLGVILTPAV